MYNRRNINDKVYNRRSNSVSGNYPNKQTKLSCPEKTNIESEYRNLRVNRSGSQGYLTNTVTQQAYVYPPYKSKQQINSKINEIHQRVFEDANSNEDIELEGKNPQKVVNFNIEKRPVSRQQSSVKNVKQIISQLETRKYVPPTPSNISVYKKLKELKELQNHQQQYLVEQSKIAEETAVKRKEQLVNDDDFILINKKGKWIGKRSDEIKESSQQPYSLTTPENNTYTPRTNKRNFSQSVERMSKAKNLSQKHDNVDLKPNKQSYLIGKFDFNDLTEHDDIDINHAPLESIIDKSTWPSLFEKIQIDKKKLLKLLKKNLKTNRIEIATVEHDRAEMFLQLINELPPIAYIRNAILRMNSSILCKKDIINLISMLPTSNEIQSIVIARLGNPTHELRSIEKFLLELASIPEIKARLEFWLFKLEFAGVLEELAGHLMDLKTAIDELKKSKTFHEVVRVMREIENCCLNEKQSVGLNSDHLPIINTLKNFYNKTKLFKYVCTIIQGNISGTSDLHSELPSFYKCSSVDWNNLDRKLTKLINDCGLARSNLEIILANNNQDNLLNSKNLIEFMSYASECVEILYGVHTRVMNRFKRFLVSLGYSKIEAVNCNVRNFSKFLSDFSLNYKVAYDEFKRRAFEESIEDIETNSSKSHKNFLRASVHESNASRIEKGIGRIFNEEQENENIDRSSFDNLLHTQERLKHYLKNRGPSGRHKPKGFRKVNTSTEYLIN